MIDSARRAILLVALVALGVTTGIASVRVWVDPTSVPVATAGITGPFAEMCGVSARVATLGVWAGMWALAALAAVAHRVRPTRVEGDGKGMRDDAAWLGAVAIVVMLGVVLRIHAATWAPWDIDEPWAFPSSATLFDDSHDALVHPPLFRALSLGWTQAIGWTLPMPRWALRIPSLLCGCLTIALIARVALPSRGPGAWIALLLAALSTAAISVSALARPYALATFAVVVIVSIAFDAGARRLTPIEAAACLVAVGVAAWSDLLAGAIAATALAARVLVDLRARRFAESVALALGALLPTLPLAPGALRALRTGIDPTTSTIAGPIPDLRAAPDTAGAAHELFAAIAAPLPVPLALALLVALAVFAWRRHERLAASFTMLACSLAALVPLFIAARARHLAWLPPVACALLAILPPSLPKRAP